MTFHRGDRVRVIGTDLYGHVSGGLSGNPGMLLVDYPDGDRGIWRADRLEHLD